MEPILLRSGELMNRDGEPIAWDLRAAAGPEPKPVIVVCHSFLAFKDWGFFPHLAGRLAEEGFAAISFNFSRNGVPPGGERISDFDAFASNSFTREIADLGDVVSAVRGGRILPQDIDGRRIALLGHSRGGGIAITHASRDPELSALVTWSAISTFDRWTGHQKSGWRKEGFLSLSGPSSPGPLRLGGEILADLGRLAEIDPVVRAPYITTPWLIVHGKADITVPARESEALAAASASGRTTLLLLDAVGHLYEARTAAADQYMTLNGIISRTVGWLRGVLNQEKP